MLETLCAITWAVTATIGFRIGGLISSRRGPPTKWALPPLSLRELLRLGAVAAPENRLLPWYFAGIALSGVLFIAATASQLL